MRNIIFTFLVIASMWAPNISGAQNVKGVEKNIDGANNLASSFSLNFSPPKALAGMSFNFSTPDGLRGFSLNFLPVIEMLSLLEGRGAQVEAKLRDIKGLTVVDLIIDGRALDPIVVECNECKLVYEF